MAKPKQHDGPTKSRRYRRARAAAGLTKIRRYRRAQAAKRTKLLRIRTLDPKAPGFRAEAERQAGLLRGAPEEAEALEFIQNAGWPQP
jgi:hypothetical protein